MGKKKALLLVVGGRAAPDVLALFCVQPHLVAILTSREGWGDEPAFREIASSLPNHEQLLATQQVDSYKFEEIRQACSDIYQAYPKTDWDWAFSIASCPKIMGIAAYEVAKENTIPCLYIDSLHEYVATFVSDIRDIPDIGIPPERLFQMTVQEYMKVYRREPRMLDQNQMNYRRKAEGWGDIAHIMAVSRETPDFTRLMHEKHARVAVPFPPALVESNLVQTLARLHAVEIEQSPNGAFTCAFTSQHFAKFLRTGDWLEVYTWHEAKEAGFASDYQWGYTIQSIAENELDVAFTYKAQLIFVECKTDGNPFFRTNYLNGISSKAEMLGGNYVTKIFITNASKEQEGYNNFYNQATLRRIVVVTAEDLPDLGRILKKEAENPTYKRI